MGLDWSFSTDRRMRRCPRQLFFANVAAWHNARDPLRREAFLLSQLKIPETWRGSVVHQAIQMLVVPYLQNNQAVAWDQVIRGALALAERQFQFSLHRRYREAGMSKKKALGDYWQQIRTARIPSCARHCGIGASVEYTSDHSSGYRLV